MITEDRERQGDFISFWNLEKHFSSGVKCEFFEVRQQCKKKRLVFFAECAFVYVQKHKRKQVTGSHDK